MAQTALRGTAERRLEALWRGIWRWIDERLGLQDLAYPVPAHANSVLYTLGGNRAAIAKAYRHT